MAAPTPERLWLLTLLGLALLAFLWLAVDRLAGLVWWASLLSLIPPQFLAPLPVVLFGLAWRGRHWNLVLTNLGLLGLVLWAAGFNLPRQATPIGGTPLRLVSLNTDRGSGGVAQVVAALRPLNADLLAFQETLGEHDQRFQQALIAAFPGWYAARHDELLILSRYPLRSADVLPFPHSPHSLLRVVLNVRGHRITVLDTHLETVGALPSPSDTRLGRGLIARTQRRDAIRQDGTKLIAQLADRAGGPLVVAGDFNLPPRGPLYRELGQHLTNAFSAVGWGWGFTHDARWPWGRIDHVWLGGRVRASEVRALPVAVSDHRPLLVKLRLP